MNKTSRRDLARYAVDQLLGGKSAKSLAKELVAASVESGIDTQFLLDDISWELERRKELTVGRVSSAHTLEPKIRADLIKQLKAATGTKQVLLDEHRDESLIGGLRVETASRVWDFSVSRKLAQLREMF